MTFVLSVLLACGTPAEPAAPEAAWTSFGAPATVANATPIATVLSDPKPHLDQVVNVEGRVSNVCAKAGCWLVLADDQGRQVRVTMKDHAFAVPKDCSGQTARIEGVLREKATDPAKVEHYKSEQTTGAVPEEGTSAHLEIEATGVRLQQG